MQTTTDFTEAGSNAEYRLLSDTQILLGTPRGKGWLNQYFDFSARRPTIRFEVDTGAGRIDLGTVQMAAIDGERTKHLTNAWRALCAMCGGAALMLNQITPISVIACDRSS
jgi:hypothetical protein